MLNYIFEMDSIVFIKARTIPLNYMHDIMYIGKSGMLRLGTITLGVRKMK